MFRYTIGITLITISIIVVRALADGKILKKHQYAFWIFIPLFMILFPFVKIDLPISYELSSLLSSVVETTTYDMESYVTTNDRDKTDTNESTALNVAAQRGGSRDITERKTEQPVKKTEQNKAVDLRTKKPVQVDVIIKYIIISIAVVLAGTLVIYNIGFIIYCRRRREYIGKDPSGKLGVYYVKHKCTPFLLLNKIYIDKNMEGMIEIASWHDYQDW